MTRDWLDSLTTEARNERSAELDRLDAREFVELMNAEDARVVEAVGRAADAIATAVDAVAERMQRGGRLIYAGAGTSGRLGVLDAAECPPTFQAEPGQVVGLIAGGDAAFLAAVEGAEDSPDRGAADVDRLAVGVDDCVVGIAASGRTPYVLGALERARAIGALTVGFSCNAGSPVEAAAELPLTVVVGPEILSGSTRLKAGTATKMVLNMLSTGAMVRLGKTYGNLMVDVQASNEKLVQRSRRIVAQAVGVELDAATAALAECGGEVKTAIVMLRRGGDATAARARLQATGGRVREALGE